MELFLNCENRALRVHRKGFKRFYSEYKVANIAFQPAAQRRSGRSLPVAAIREAMTFFSLRVTLAV